MAQMAHDGYARAISPVHTPGDGDTIFSAATGTWDGRSTTARSDRSPPRSWPTPSSAPRPRRRRRTGCPARATWERSRALQAVDCCQFSQLSVISISAVEHEHDATFLCNLPAAGVSPGSSASGGRFGQAPASSPRLAREPAIPSGVTAGDVGGGRAVIWSRTDRAARMFVEFSTTERFADPRRVRGPAALEASDFTSRLTLTDLPAGQRIFYRVLYQDLSDLRTWSEPVAGSFTTPSTTPRDITHRLVRRHRRTGLGHQSRVGRPAPLRNDAARAARRVHQRRRHDLRRPAAAAGSEAGRREHRGRTW